MAQLKRKAGLSPDFWHDDVEIYRYTVTKFKEKDLRQQRSTERLTS
jgi:AMMECR1 domain-containing protein